MGTHFAASSAEGAAQIGSMGFAPRQSDQRSGLKIPMARQVIVNIVIGAYRFCVRPFIFAVTGPVMSEGRSCRYEVHCSEYSKQVLLNQGLLVGSWLSFKRVISCQPWFQLRGMK